MDHLSRSRFLLAPAALALFAAAGFAFPPPPQTEAQKALEAQKKQVQAALTAKEVAALKWSYIVLDGANNNYAGHKGNAMHEIEVTLNLLDGNALKQAQAVGQVSQRLNASLRANLLSSQAATPDLVQALSDAQVANANVILNQVAGLLAANKKPNPLEHVKNAITQLNTAPKHPAPGPEGC